MAEIVVLVAPVLRFRCVITAVALAFALSIDAALVALSRGVGASRNERFSLPLLFGAFQAGMATLGYFAGEAAARSVERTAPWIAAGLLAAVGIKFIIDGVKKDSNDDQPQLLVPLAFATSIDAAATGPSLTTLSVAPVLSLALIGGVTVVNSALCFLLGKSLSPRLGTSKWPVVASGLTLIALSILQVARAN